MKNYHKSGPLIKNISIINIYSKNYRNKKRKMTGFNRAPGSCGIIQVPGRVRFLIPLDRIRIQKLGIDPISGRVWVSLKMQGTRTRSPLLIIVVKIVYS